MRVALVYDRLNKLGGAEVLLQALHSYFPHADWYTSVWDPSRALFSQTWQVHPSFLNRLSFLRRHHEFIPFLMPFAFESFDFSDYDLVISVGSAECKGIITRATTSHLHYCLTPTRYLWSHRHFYLTHPQFGLFQRLATPFVKTIFTQLARWDLVAATRPDHLITISKHVQKRIKKYYNRSSQVIYPPVNLERFSSYHAPGSIHREPYYLTVSRLVPYKNLELLLRVFAGTPRRLLVIGTGTLAARLRRMASSNIVFLGQVAEIDLVGYYQHCRAFIQANIEDLGLAMIEAQAAGRPVIAYNKGGAREVVIDGKTGLFVSQPTLSAFRKTLDKFERMKFVPSDCRRQASYFSLTNWRSQFTTYLHAHNL